VTTSGQIASHLIITVRTVDWFTENGCSTFGWSCCCL